MFTSSGDDVAYNEFVRKHVDYISDDCSLVLNVLIRLLLNLLIRFK